MATGAWSCAASGGTTGCHRTPRTAKCSSCRRPRNTILEDAPAAALFSLQLHPTGSIPSSAMPPHPAWPPRPPLQGPANWFCCRRDAGKPSQLAAVTEGFDPTTCPSPDHQLHLQTSRYHVHCPNAPPPTTAFTIRHAQPTRPYHDTRLHYTPSPHHIQLHLQLRAG